ncbi:MAG TPA: NAD(P)-dependent oxidoreductase [Ignavibacteriales bacterium]|nr:NAD(P)-dependent oxidoreductase [Ignavibacteriales bacterium]HOL82159.1 NAD(P)-dependent oxidoreductase [Ignavibacteriales bacterium]HOM65739.1 NAD(P)-dependent oxidoreductase [Ignavibacteriales bacterium]HPD67594.1 NAD(P)-dependent oxidoreductase [Ignavibacteriales bacterium]HPP34287.1 NAD(P)-dependent oxidoreductase [Ignavibacteriales bacterium]
MDNNLSKKIAIVTGASGFVGSHLVDLLLKHNYEVICLVRNSSNLRWLENKPVKIEIVNFNKIEEFENIFTNASFIYHVAGVVKSKKPEGYFKGNVDTTKLLLDAAVKYCNNLERFLYVSSQAACGPSTKDQPKTEEDPLQPITTYGKSKKAAEELVRTYFDKLPITICRPPAVYGERDTEILIFFKTFNSGLFTTIGLNDKTVSLINVKDLVKGFYLAATNPNANHQTYFISSEKFYTWTEIGKVTQQVLGKKAIHIKVPHFIVYTLAAISEFFALFSKNAATLNIEKAKDIVQNYWTCDTSKAVKELGYKQEISLEQGIKETIDWYKKVNWL